jgi:hypothetical protein
MSILEKWRDIQFHKRLWKTDERMLKLQIEIDAKEEAKLEIAQNLLAEGATYDFVQKITGLKLETIEKLQEQKVI